MTLPVPSAFAFPVLDTWFPDPDQLTNSGAMLLAIAGAALDYVPLEAGSRGTVYERRVLTTGNIVPIVPDQDGQLVVSLMQMAVGRAGEERFQFFKGTLGAYAQKFVRFNVQLARKSPEVVGGISPRMQTAAALEDRASELWTDAWVVWSALMAMCLGGVKDADTGAQVSAAPLTQDNVLIGRVAFEPPDGGMAVAAMEVQIQL